MKIVDMEGYEVVDSGQSWKHEKKPCHREMLPVLEQNESIVTWIRPRGSMGTSDQIPVIRIRRQYYSISLRMMKAIWRHVRLAKDFVNSDVSKDGTPKLRIPMKLFCEKKRTQNRFNTMRSRPSKRAATPPLLPQSSKRQDQFHVSMQGKSHRLFCELIMPLARDPAHASLPRRTSFVFTEEDILASTLSRIDRKCPQLCRDREGFMRAVERIVFGGC